MISPVIALGLAGSFFLPETTGNIIRLLKQYEEQVPIVWDTHQSIKQDVKKLKDEGVKEVAHITDKLNIKK